MNETDKKKKTSDQLAEERTKLAQLRNDLAENRTLQAAERTYAAWIRTGFTMAGAGWTLGELLNDTASKNLALVIGGALIFLGLMCFVYAWVGFKAVYDYLKKISIGESGKEYPVTMNLLTVTIMSVVLFIIFVVAFAFLLF